MAKMVPYQTFKQRWTSFIVVLSAFVITALIWRYVVGFDDTWQMLAPLAVALVVVAALRWWAYRSCPLVARDELLSRYATELLELPTWKLVLLYATGYALPWALFTVLADKLDNNSRTTLLLMIVLLAYLGGTASAYFTRRDAAKRVGRSL